MIKSVDLLEVKSNTPFKSFNLFFNIVVFPVATILLTFLNHHYFVLAVSLQTIAIIILQIFLIPELCENDKKIHYPSIIVLSAYVILVWIIGSSAVPPCIKKNILTLAVIGYLPIFFIINSEAFLREIKSILYNYFVKRKKIKLFVPKDDLENRSYGNFWPPQNPFSINFLDSNGEPIKKSKYTYISIHRRIVHDTNSAFRPIHSIIACKKLLGDGNERQKYFNTIYTILVMINFLYFFSALILTKALSELYGFNEIMYIFVAFVVIANLVATIYLFIKHLAVTKCDEKIIYSEIENLETTIDDGGINKHYLTFSLGRKKVSVDHDKELEELEKTNEKLVEKLDNIYQIVTPILFLSQVTLSIAFIKFFILKGN